VKTDPAATVKAGLQLACAFSKIDEEKREVWGVATSEALDVQGEIVDYEASKQAFGEWADQFSKVTNGESLGNIREMHQPRPVGRLISWRPDDSTKTIHVGVKLSRSPEGESAWQKVKERVLNGFSIGAPTAERRMEYASGKPRNRVVSYKLSELSLVDNPACPDAWISEVKLAKAAGGVSEALDVIEAEPFVPKENAFVDSDGGVWKRIEGVFKKGEPMTGIEKKNIGPSHRGEGKAPGVETPTVQGDPEPKTVLPKKAEGGGMEEGSAVIPGGPHDDASKPVSPPATQGKAAGDMAYGSAGGPPAPVAPPAPASAAPPAPAPAAAPMRYSYCAMCAGKLADGSAPIHQECGAPKPPTPPAAAPAGGPAAPAPFPPKAASAPSVGTPDGSALSPADGQGKAAASLGDAVSGMEKAYAAGFSKLADAVNQMNQGFTALLARVEKIEKSPIPGGPARTELPYGVTAVEKGGDAAAKAAVSEEAALLKAMEIVEDPMMRDRISQTLAKRAIKRAQSGR
jgi:hypothetical protein